MKCVDFSLTYENLAEAVLLAESVHRHQYDLGGVPYLRHVAMVGFSLLPDVEAAIVGLLHDTLEDVLEANRAATSLAIMRGFGPTVRAAVLALTRKQPTSYPVYIRHVKRNALARRVKLADLRNNLDPERLRLAATRGADVDRLKSRYIAALKVLEA